MTAPPPPIDPPRFNVLRISLSTMDPGDAVGIIVHRIAVDASAHVYVTGVHGVMESQDDEDLCDVYNGADLVIRDGMPIVWLAHMADSGTSTGFADATARWWSAGTGWRGATGTSSTAAHPGLRARLASRVIERFPGMLVAATYSTLFRDLSKREDADVVEMIREARVDVMWAVLGAPPKSDGWRHTKAHSPLCASASVRPQASMRTQSRRPRGGCRETGGSGRSVWLLSRAACGAGTTYTTRDSCTYSRAGGPRGL